MPAPFTPFTLAPSRFLFTGISLSPTDLLGPGKLPFVQNVRSYEEGTLVPRNGLTQITSTPVGAAVHTLARLNDPRPDASQPALRVIGAGTGLFAAAPGSAAFPSIDAGPYSGDPLTTTEAIPVGSPQPFLYIGDRTRTRKVAVDGTDHNHGIPQPASPDDAPTALLQAPLETLVSELDVAAAWAEVGGIGGGLSNQTRISTTISAIVYDSGSTGYASIGGTSMANINPGMHLRVAGAETVLVTDVLVAIASTTIGAIIYDSGSTGACTILPVGSLGVGQLEGPSYREHIERRLNRDQVPRPSNIAEDAIRVTRIRRIDFPVHCLVRINSGGGSDEVVQITSVAIGTDGLESFRCIAANTHSAAETLDGIAGFRAATTGTRAVANTVVGSSIRHTLTTVSDGAVVAGINDTTLPVNLGQIATTQPTRPDDEILFSLRVDLLRYVDEVRLYLDVDLAAPATFLNNYYLRVWRANDLVTAIQDTNAAVTDPLLTSKTGAVLSDQVDETPVDTTGATVTPEGFRRGDAAVVGQAKPGSHGSHAGTPGTGATVTPEGYRRGDSVAIGVAERRDTTDTERQLALGNNQWLTLRTTVRDLIRIGNDPARTLGNVGGVQILLTFTGRAGAFVVDYGALLLTGGFGPDVRHALPPYLYTYRYRSTLTGAVSNPAPVTRGSVVPRRQAVALTATLSTDPQVDLLDWFRLGGTLTTWAYLGTSPNSGTPSLTDDRLDGAIEGGDELRFNQFQPWPVTDTPASGVVNVAGTAISRVSGDFFDTGWAPSTQILVNGVAATLYGSPVSTSLLHVVENLGSATSATWNIPSPLLLAQPLPAIWYGLISGVSILFACGNARDPGVLTWCFGNNPEVTSDANWLSVAGSDETLLNGFVHEGVCFAFSDCELYRMLPAFGSIQTFTPTLTRCGRGLVGIWAMALTPVGVCFVADDGVYLSAWGAPAVSLTSPDLQDLFPHDGAPGQAVNGIEPPDLTAVTDVRLSYVDGFIYFDHLTTIGTRRTLLYELRTQRWFYDRYDKSAIRTRLDDPGDEVHAQILGGSDGHVYQYDRTQLIDAGIALAYDVWTHWPDAGDPRGEKIASDLVLDVDPRGSVNGITAAPVFNNAQTILTGITVGVGVSGRQQLSLNPVSGTGLIARNFGLRISGSLGGTDTGRPTLYEWIFAWIPNWVNAGTPGAKFMQGLVVHVDTGGAASSFRVDSDGPTGSVVDRQTFVVPATTDETSFPFSFTTPFTAHLVRLVPLGSWRALRVEWTWEPAPESALRWQTQPTTHDFPGYLAVRDAMIAYAATAAVTLTVTYTDGVTTLYTLPATADAYSRFYLPLAARKGTAVTYDLLSTEAFQLFQRDCTVRVQAWGRTGGLQTVNPFGGLSRARGARI